MQHPPVVPGEHLAELPLVHVGLRVAVDVLAHFLEQRRGLASKPGPKVADSLSEYATLLVKRAEFDSAEPLYREALTAAWISN